MYCLRISITRTIYARVCSICVSLDSKLFVICQHIYGNLLEIRWNNIARYALLGRVLKRDYNKKVSLISREYCLESCLELKHFNTENNICSEIK